MFAASCLNLLEMCWACLCIIFVMISKNFELVVAHQFSYQPVLLPTSSEIS
jgi:hypothetical protein